MFKRTLSLHKSQSDVCTALNRQLRLYLPYGKVSPNTFRLYKAVKDRDNLHGPFFIIKGTYTENKDTTLLSYSIFPSLFLTVFCCVLPLVLIYALVCTDYSLGVPYFLLAAILLNALQILCLVLSLNEINEDFTDRLK